MKLYLRLVLLVTGLVFSTTTAFADDPVPGSPEDNACYEGGVMAGKCDTPWEWTCGYYLARWFSAGGWAILDNTIPSWCNPAVMLPPAPPPPDPNTPAVTTICKSSPGPLTVCLTSSQTGTYDYYSDGVFEQEELFTDMPAHCPSSYNGRMFMGAGSTTNGTAFGFSLTELFDVLGLGVVACSYQ